MKKENVLFIILTLIIMIVTSMATSYAVSDYLYNSNEVNYDNTSTGITSDNVQGAIDELYDNANDYASINSRVISLESHLLNNPTFDINNSSGTWLNFYTGGKNRLSLGVNTSGEANIVAKNASETAGQGTLSLETTSLQINGKNVNSILNFQSLSSTNNGTSVNNNATATTTGSITSISGASNYMIIPYSCNFGFPTSVSKSGNSITVKAINGSGGTHSMTCHVLSIAY